VAPWLRAGEARPLRAVVAPSLPVGEAALPLAPAARLRPWAPGCLVHRRRTRKRHPADHSKGGRRNTNSHRPTTNIHSVPIDSRGDMGARAPTTTVEMTRVEAAVVVAHRRRPRLSPSRLLCERRQRRRRKQRQQRNHNHKTGRPVHGRCFPSGIVKPRDFLSLTGRFGFGRTLHLDLQERSLVAGWRDRRPAPSPAKTYPGGKYHKGGDGTELSL
jgi:hypothetical protein